jgi:hypothetical protein
VEGWIAMESLVFIVVARKFPGVQVIPVDLSLALRADFLTVQELRRIASGIPYRLWFNGKPLLAVFPLLVSEYSWGLRWNLPGSSRGRFHGGGVRCWPILVVKGVVVPGVGEVTLKRREKVWFRFPCCWLWILLGWLRCITAAWFHGPAFVVWTLACFSVWCLRLHGPLLGCFVEFPGGWHDFAVFFCLVDFWTLGLRWILPVDSEDRFHGRGIIWCCPNLAGIGVVVFGDWILSKIFRWNLFCDAKVPSMVAVFVVAGILVLLWIFGPWLWFSQADFQWIATESLGFCEVALDQPWQSVLEFAVLLAVGDFQGKDRRVIVGPWNGLWVIMALWIDFGALVPNRIRVLTLEGWTAKESLVGLPVLLVGRFSKKEWHSACHCRAKERFGVIFW